MMFKQTQPRVVAFVAMVVMATAACTIENVRFLSDASDGDGGTDAPSGPAELVVSTNAMTVPEGMQGTFTVVLSNAPEEPVLVNLTTNNDVKLGLTPTALLFGASDWNVVQVVTTTGREDADVEDEVIAVDVISTALGSVRTVVVTVGDNDGLGIIATPSAGLDVNEGATTTIAVRLSAQPAAPTAVNVTSTDPSAATATPSQLTFTTASWNIDQIVTVTGVEDANTTNNGSSLQLAGAGLADVAIPISIVDNDVLGIDPSSTNLGVMGEGTQRTFTVRLTQQPPAGVTVAVASSDPTAVTVSPASLAFTTVNWSTAQTVTVTAPQDLETVDENASITLTSAGLTTRTVAVTVDDDDDQAITATPNPASVTEGATSVVNVRLAFQPVGNATVNVTSLATGIATVTPAMLTFTPGNYATTQPVTLAGVEDADAANGATSLRLEEIASGLVTDVPVTVVDNDTLAIETDVPTVTLGEAGSATFQARLSAMPVATTTINVTSGDTSAATVAPSSLTYTTANWNTYQTVTVAGVQDVDLAVETVVISLAGSGITTKTLTATVSDDDTQAVKVSSGTVAVIEGSSTTVGVSLQYQPAANVTVSVLSAATAVATATPATLTFTPVNYLNVQNVTITGAHDANTTPNSTTVSLTSAGATSATVTVNVTDDDVLAIQTSAASVNVNEGSTATFGVRLSAQPAATTTVMVASNASGSATVSPATLSFTTTTWNTYQNVTVAGVQDADSIDDLATAILSSTGLANVNVAITVVDDDTLAIATTVGSVSLGEGGTAMFGVHLSAMPAANVTVTVTSGDTGAATVAPTSLSFTTANYATDQFVTVTGVQDVDLAAESVTLTLTAPGLANRIVTASVTDDDTQAVIITSSLTIVEGTTGTLNVRLTYQPAANVTVAVVSNNTGVASVAPAMLTFTSANYGTNQGVTVTGVEDGNTATDVATITASSAGATSGTSTVTVTDNDTLDIVLSSTSVIAVEAGSTTIGVKLSAQPSGNVTVNIVAGNTAVATVGTASVTFTTTTWNTFQNITVFGFNDPDLLHESTTVSFSSSGLTTRVATVQVPDNDLISVSPSSVTMCEFDFESVNVVFLAAPHASFDPTTLTITSSDPAKLMPSPTSHVFTGANFSTSRAVFLETGNITGTAIVPLTFSAPGQGSKTISVTIKDFNQAPCNY